MAEVLVNLTAFLMQMRMSKAETVTRSVDVAILSKGDGFIWAKHKDLRREFRGRAMPVVAKIAKPTGSKLVKGQAESGEICSVEVEEK